MSGTLEETNAKPTLDIAHYEDIVAFTAFSVEGYTVALYDRLSSVGVATPIFGIGVSTHEGTVAFASPEEIAGVDFNGDGDTMDSVIRYFKIGLSADLAGRKAWAESRRFTISKDEDAFLAMYARIHSTSAVTLRVNLFFTILDQNSVIAVLGVEGLIPSGISESQFSTLWMPPRMEAEYVITAECFYKGASTSDWSFCSYKSFTMVVVG